ncbi:hypothetical protein NUSPORA_00178 [Nucleospora cyclopteri]
MEKNKTDFQILVQLLYQYAWKFSEIRIMIIPSIASVIVSKMLFVQSSKYIRKITSAVGNHSVKINMIIHYGLCIFSNVVLGELCSLYTCKAGHIGYTIASKRAYEYFLLLYPGDFNKIGKGEMQNTIQRYSEAVKDILDVLTLIIMPFIATVLISLISIMPILGPLAVFVIMLTVCLYIIATVKITIWRNQYKIKINKNTDKTQNVLNDGLNNFEVIYTLGTEINEVTRYNKCLLQVQSSNLVFDRARYCLNMVQGFIWSLQLFLLISVQCLIIKMDKPEDITFILSIISMFHTSLNNLGFMYGKYKTGMINIRQTNLPIRKMKSEGFRKVSILKEQIAVYDLSFGYNNKVVLDCASFIIKKGEKIAVVGENGSGKSTLLKSLIKYNESDAQIFIDEYNSDDICDKSYRNLITYVPQNATLFDETILYNIKYGNNSVYDEQIFKMAHLLGIHDSITRLEQGYNTLCGENGSALSGGERQKVTILRALMRNSSVLLMDEPTANMDKKSELKILESINKIEDLTVVSIIHNHNLLHLYNRILKVENGKVTSLSGPIN